MRTLIFLIWPILGLMAHDSYAALNTQRQPSVFLNLNALEQLRHSPKAVPLEQVTPVYEAAPVYAAPQAATAQPTYVQPAPQILTQPVATQDYALPKTSPDLAKRARKQAAPAAAAAQKDRGYVEVGGNYHNVSDGLGDWKGQYIEAEIQATKSDRFGILLLNQEEFDDTGQYVALSNTHIFNEDWFTSLTVGAGTDAFFLPNYRVDGFINRKLLDSKRLIATVGFGVYKAPDIYKDYSGFLGLTYYFEDPWVVQGGVRFNRSTPGDVDSFSQFVAATYGRDQEYFLTGRYGFGEESYQLIGPANAISEFDSHSASAEWRHWLSDDWGFNLRGEYYDNPNYDRTGTEFGIFREF